MKIDLFLLLTLTNVQIQYMMIAMILMQRKTITTHAAKATAINRALSIDYMEPSLRSPTPGIFQGN